MRRLMLLTLLALVLPTAALANSSFFQLQIGPPLTVGNFSGGSSGCLSQPTISCSTGNYLDGHNINVGGNVWLLNLVGPTGRIVLDITRLTTLTGGNCALNGGVNSLGTCNFSGTVTAFGSSVPGGTFTDSISGMLTRGPNASTPTPVPWVITTLTGELGNKSGNLSVEDVQLCRSSNATIGCGSPGDHGRLRSGHGSAKLSVVPEPGTLGLFGTGLFGLAGLVRRKLKVGT
jgi:hypothetical protein